MPPLLREGGAARPAPVGDQPGADPPERGGAFPGLPRPRPPDAGRVPLGRFWACPIPLSLGLVVNVWQGFTPGHLFVLDASGLVWYLAWRDAGRWTSEQAAPCRRARPARIHVSADMVVVAIGSRPDLGFLPGSAVFRPVDRNGHVSRLQFRENAPRIPVYAWGDCVNGPGTVVGASASGRAAALNIYGDLCVEEVRKGRLRDNDRRASEPRVEDRPE